jgi:hypothetical protein
MYNFYYKKLKHILDANEIKSTENAVIDKEDSERERNKHLEWVI